jgi:NADH dehydrogenase (ubiquinone) 1 alpha subcomplex subunit 9
MLYDDNTAGQTYELYGPKNYSTAELAEMVDREIFKKRRHINVPKAILKPVAGLLNRVLWWPIMSADEVEREFHDQQIDEAAKTFKDLGMEPAEISNFLYHYLVSGLLSWVEDIMTDSHIARIPELSILRSTSNDREGEKRR